MNEGIWIRSIPDPGEYEYGPTTGGGTGGWGGGVADPWDPHGQQSPYYGYVVSGSGGFNQDFVSGGPQTNASAAHYYSGYWAGVEAALYGGFGAGPFGNLKPWPFGAQPDDPFTYHFLIPAPHTRQASSAIGHVLAAIGAAIAPPAEANPRDFSRIPASLLPVGEGGAPGGGSPIPQDMFASDSDSAAGGRGPVTKADIAAELARADQFPVPGMGRSWQIRLLREITRERDFFPYPTTPEGLDAVMRFGLNVTGDAGEVPLHSFSGFPAFPVYKQIFGPGTPPLFMGWQGVALSREFGGAENIFKWGPIVPP